MMQTIRLFIASIALAAVAAGGWFAYRLAGPPPLPRTATVLPAPADLPEFSLVDGHGNAFDRDSLRGSWSLLFFGFTHCPDVCPLTLQALASARQELETAGIEPLPRIVFVSVDPERDTAEVVRDYAAHFGAATTGVTGDMTQLRQLTNGLGIFFQKSNRESDNYSVDHSAVVLLVGPDAKFHALFGAPHEAANFVHDLPLIMASR
jgi:protein SCO1/2